MNTENIESSQELAERAFDLMDKSFYESFFFHPGGPIGVEGNGLLVMGCLFGLIIIISLFFNRNNGYTSGHHSRASSYYYGAVILVLVPYFVFRPSPESLEKTEIELTSKMHKKMSELEIIDISNETNPVNKLKSIEYAVDSSGKAFYVLGAVYNPEYNSFDDEQTPVTHYYINNHNYQSEYISLLKKVEKEFRSSTYKDLDTAIFLEDVFSEGNVFVKYNINKANYFENQVKKIKKDQLSRTPQVKAIKPVSV